MKRPTWVRGSTHLAAALMVLSACAGATSVDSATTTTPATSTPDPSPTSAVAAEPVDVLPPRCSDVAGLSGTGTLVDPAARPLFMTENGDDDLRETLRRYASSYPDTFGGFWIDRVDGAFALAFTDDIDGHVARLGRLAEGRHRVTVIEAQVTEAELMDRQNELSSLLGPGSRVYGMGARQTHGLVFLDLSVYDDESIATVVEAVGPELICLDGPDPADVIPEGPQATSGDGWRLLVSAGGRGAPYRTGFADSRDELERLWSQLDVPSDTPDVDFTREAVVYFGPAVSSSCPDVRLDEVVFDDDQVRPVIVLPGGARVCTSDANPHAFVVAVDRGRLPDRPFTIDLFEDPCGSVPGVCLEQRTRVGD